MVSSYGHISVTDSQGLDYWFAVALEMAGDKRVISAFSEDQVVRLTGLPVQRLRYWQETEFFIPSFHFDAEERFGRLYSFKDVVCLRTIALLRGEHRVPLSRLRKTFEHLFNMDQGKWASETLYVLNRRVYFEVPEGGDFQETTSPQLALHYIPLRKVAAETAEVVAEARERPQESIGKIEKIRGVRGSRPVVSGTRIPVQTIVDYYREGATFDQIIKEYPRLTEADVRAALEYSGLRVA